MKFSAVTVAAFFVGASAVATARDVQAASGAISKDIAMNQNDETLDASSKVEPSTSSSSSSSALRIVAAADKKSNPRNLLGLLLQEEIIVPEVLDQFGVGLEAPELDPVADGICDEIDTLIPDDLVEVNCQCGVDSEGDEFQISFDCVTAEFGFDLGFAALNFNLTYSGVGVFDPFDLILQGELSLIGLGEPELSEVTSTAEASVEVSGDVSTSGSLLINYEHSTSNPLEIESCTVSSTAQDLTCSSCTPCDNTPVPKLLCTLSTTLGPIIFDIPCALFIPTS